MPVCGANSVAKMQNKQTEPNGTFLRVWLSDATCKGKAFPLRCWSTDPIFYEAAATISVSSPTLTTTEFLLSYILNALSAPLWICDWIESS